MDYILSVIYLVFFFGIAICLVKVVKDMNIEKFFKQGKVQSIRFAYILFIIITSSLAAWALTNLSEKIMNLFSI